jgi:hypothetical protein
MWRNNDPWGLHWNLYFLALAACAGEQHAQGAVSCPGRAACPEEQHVQGSSIVEGDTACPERVACLGKLLHQGDTACPEGAICPRKQHSQGDTACPRGAACLGSSILRGRQHAQGEQHARVSNSQGETPCPGGAASLGGQHKRAIFSSFDFISWCPVELFYCMLLPRELCSPCPLGMLHPRYTASPAHAVPFWACCCPLGLQPPIWKALLGMLLPGVISTLQSTCDI